MSKSITGQLGRCPGHWRRARGNSLRLVRLLLCLRVDFCVLRGAVGQRRSWPNDFDAAADIDADHWSHCHLARVPICLWPPTPITLTGRCWSTDSGDRFVLFVCLSRWTDENWMEIYRSTDELATADSTKFGSGYRSSTPSHVSIFALGVCWEAQPTNHIFYPLIWKSYSRFGFLRLVDVLWRIVIAFYLRPYRIFHGNFNSFNLVLMVWKIEA